MQRCLTSLLRPDRAINVSYGRGWSRSSKHTGDHCVSDGKRSADGRAQHESTDDADELSCAARSGSVKCGRKSLSNTEVVASRISASESSLEPSSQVRNSAIESDFAISRIFVRLTSWTFVSLEISGIPAIEDARTRWSQHSTDGPGRERLSYVRVDLNSLGVKQLLN